MVILYLYSAILWWAKRTKHDLIYEYFRVRHPKRNNISEEEYWASDSDFTVRHNKEEE